MEKTKALLAEGWNPDQRKKQATWAKSSKEGTEREAKILGMSEDLKEHVEEELKWKEEFKEDVEEWQQLCDGAEVHSEGKGM